MDTKISFWHRITDFISPQSCVVCGRRLALTEVVICSSCNLALPRTDFAAAPYDNIMAKSFWGRMAVERAAALLYYQSHSEVASLIYEIKYAGDDEAGVFWGKMVAKEMLATCHTEPETGKKQTFFEGIDAIVPVPLSKRRERERGYNQSREIAKGVAEITGLPLVDKTVVRKVFKESQTHKGRWERNANVEGVFALQDGRAIDGKHLLIVDDIVTTGATVCSLAQELGKAGKVRLSILSIGFTK